MNQEIIIIIGLPGSGKSTYLAQKYINEIVFDDFHKYNKKLFEESIYYSDFLAALQKEKKIVLSDISYCRSEKLNNIENKIRELKNNVNITKIYFENNPKLCKKNVLYRDRKSAGLEIKLINKLSQKYIIPKEAIPIQIKTFISQPTAEQFSTQLLK